IVGAAGSVILGIWSFFRGNGLRGIVMLCAGAVLAGLSIPLFYGCMAATGGAVGLPAKITDWVQSLFYRKENAS
ncbi:MAG: hypothetical protein J6U26_04250, partial [Lachnospiraceae bacterium]|nr:hypothetical protein [Lachnospiraceae bacterium]